MITIRDEMMRIFEEAALRAFEDEMVRHLERSDPGLCEVPGEAAVRRVIRLGVERAKGYGLTDRGPVRLYIELMVLLGSHFDTDPLLPWARAILDDPSIRNQGSRANRLYERATAYFHEVAGPDDEYLIDAMLRIHRAAAEVLPPLGPDLEEAALTRLSSIYPEKCESVGEPALRALIRRGPELARHHSAGTDLGVALFIALPFALGHGFATDPLYPWISEVLNDPLVTEISRRAERLKARAMGYLGRLLDDLEQS
jgi:hypothetical protein